MLKDVKGNDFFYDSLLFSGFFLLALGLPVVVSYSVFWHYDLPRLTLLRFLTLVLLGIFLFKQLESSKIEISFTSFDFLFLSFLALVALATLFSLHLPSSFFGSYGRFEGFLTFLNYALIYFLAANFFREKNLAPFTRIIPITAALIALFSLTKLLFYLSEETRISATFGNPDYAGAYFVLVFPLAVTHFFWEKENYRLLWGLSLFLITLALIATYTRAAWLALLFSIIFLFFLIRKEVSLKKLSGAVLIILLAFGFLTSQNLWLKKPQEKPYLVERAREVTAVKGSVASRLQMWRDSLKVIKSDPLTGTGVDAFAFGIQRYASFKLMKLEPPGEGVDYLLRDPHNHFLYLAASSGLPAFLIYLVLLILLFFLGLKAPREKGETLLLRGILTSIFGYLVILQLIPSSIDLTSLWWLMIGLAMSKVPGKKFSYSLKINLRVAKILVAVLILPLLTLSVFSFLADYSFQHSFTGNHLQNEFQAKRALRFAPYNEFFFIHLAEIYQRLGELDPKASYFEKAIKQAKIAQKRNPKNAYSFYFLGELYAALAPKNPLLSKKAGKEYQKALSLFPNYPQAHLGLGKVYLETGRFKEAHGELKKAVDLSPNSETYFYWGEIQEKLKSP